jgi:hypothetical protein
MARRNKKIPKWQMELLEAWNDAGFPDHFKYTFKKGRMRGQTQSTDAIPEIAQYWRGAAPSERKNPKL